MFVIILPDSKPSRLPRKAVSLSISNDVLGIGDIFGKGSIETFHIRSCRLWFHSQTCKVYREGLTSFRICSRHFIPLGLTFKIDMLPALSAGSEGSWRKASVFNTIDPKRGSRQSRLPLHGSSGVHAWYIPVYPKPETPCWAGRSCRQ